MIFNKKMSTIFILSLVILACFIEETEAKRRVLRGRRTITRTYNRGLGIPSWVIILLVAILEIGIGVGLYFGMRKWIIVEQTAHGNTYSPAIEDDV